MTHVSAETAREAITGLQERFHIDLLSDLSPIRVEQIRAFIDQSAILTAERDSALAEVERMRSALRLADGRLSMLMAASLPDSDHPGATAYVLATVRAALHGGKNG